ncbi:NAD-dependent epimerase/dehydratase family protein [Photobacterium alginatilyticum]|uniref:NAD-dependent epimerase/dehydratase family protein n=1 Tax=Photobacterium alginatilyticum TaxID=1775171 RepID=A0ABW9YDF6_9GAMM|nr:NAD-dependent epimerase/dehydratase family protein [Photobacterium alginatilyticum]NBI51613.1 NAD-dependent epimerase/dehydratase family protein [Photobacterium alginatilyticum]
MCELKNRILVTGANGFIGKHLIKRLLVHSEVVAAVRTDLSRLNYLANTGHLEVVPVGNLSETTDWAEALSDIDVVVHLAGRAHQVNENPSKSLELFRRVNCKASVALLEQAARSGVKRFIFISSIGVIGNVSGAKPFCEKTQCNPTAAYAISKLEAENSLITLAGELGLELVIVRPPLVFGHDAPGNFGRLIHLVKRIPVLPFGLVKNRRSFVSINNLINFIEVCIEHPNAANELFVIADEDVISTKDLTDYLAASLDRTIVQFPFPLSVFRCLLKLVGKESLAIQLLDNLEVDVTKAKTLLNWKAIESTKSSLKNIL